MCVIFLGYDVFSQPIVVVDYVLPPFLFATFGDFDTTIMKHINSVFEKRNSEERGGRMTE